MSLSQDDLKQIKNIVATEVSTSVDNLAQITARGFLEVDKRLDGVDQRLDCVEKRMDGVEKHMDSVEKHMDGIESSLNDVELRLEKVEKNTEIYPYDKEYVDEKLTNHEARITKLELKKI